MEIVQETLTVLRLHNRLFGKQLWAYRLLGIAAPTFGAIMILFSQGDVFIIVSGLMLVLGLFTVGTPSIQLCILDIGNNNLTIKFQRSYQQHTKDVVYALDEFVLLGIYGNKLRFGFLPNKFVVLGGDEHTELVKIAQRIQAFIPHKIDIVQ